MNLLNKLTIKNLKLNKKRTIVTIIGIMLSVALITAVATMYSSAVKSLVSYEKYQKGDFHVAFYDVNENDLSFIKNNKGVDRVYITNNIGYAKMEGSKNEYKPYAYVKGFTEDALEGLAVKLMDGRLPQNENEVLIPNHLKTNGRVEYKIGDTIPLEVGTRVSDGYELNQNNPYNEENNEEIINTTTRTYTVVGIIERPANNVENYSAPGYTFITYLADDKIPENIDVYARFNRYGSSNYLKVMSDVLGVSEEAMTKQANNSYETEEEYDQIMAELDKAKYDFNINSYLILLENNPLKESTMGGLGAVVVIVLIIIVVTSVFCIKNSFDISITEKIKQYGMLRSVGATKKQIKRNVFYEGTILGLIGIPLGLLLGFGASIILIQISNLLLGDAFASGLRIYFGFSWVAVLVACVLGSLTIYFSALRSANKAARVSPISSIRNSAEIKVKSKKLKAPVLVKKLFGIGGEISYKNFKRNKKKYRTTILSVAVSVSIFIGLSYFVGGAFRGVANEITTYDYNVSVSIYPHGKDVALYNKLLQTTSLDGIEDYTVYRYSDLFVNDAKYLDSYFDLMFGDSRDGEALDHFYEYEFVYVITLGEHPNKAYLKELRLDYDEYQDKAILYAGNEECYKLVDGKEQKQYSKKYKYKNGDTIRVTNKELNIDRDITIGYVSETKPFGNYYYNTILIVPEKIFNEILPENYDTVANFQASDPNKLQDEIEVIMEGENYYLENLDESARLMNNLFTLIAIFLYGFIIVISLIGITNIFNTITTNMNLRKQEFAMLKSVGMTSREFKNMIRLESAFIGAKALAFGISIGLGLSYLIYHFMEAQSGFVFSFPVVPIVISIVVVYLLITVLMRYSMSKIGKENTIETIRNENI